MLYTQNKFNLVGGPSFKAWAYGSAFVVNTAPVKDDKKCSRLFDENTHKDSTLFIYDDKEQFKFKTRFIPEEEVAKRINNDEHLRVAECPIISMNLISPTSYMKTDTSLINELVNAANGVYQHFDDKTLRPLLYILNVQSGRYCKVSSEMIQDLRAMYGETIEYWIAIARKEMQLVETNPILYINQEKNFLVKFGLTA